MASNARWAVNIVDGSVGNTVHNNILANRNTGRGAINIGSDSLAGFTSDYNLVIGNRFTPNDGDTFMTLAQWRVATGRDLHSLVATEAGTFTDPAVNDYHLGDSSSAIDGGDALFAPTTDRDGNLRDDGSPDIGAFEYGIPAPPVPSLPPTTTTLNVLEDISIVGETVTFTVSVAATPGTPTGTVTFFDGHTALGAARLDGNGEATFRVATLRGGLHAITAIYSGNESCAASSSSAVSHMVLAL
jgi:hypothetical protein